MLEIVISESERLLLQRTKLFYNENITSFSLLLSFGKIKDVKLLDIRKICNQEINIQEKLKELDEKVKDIKKVRIWYSSLDNEDMNSLYFLIYYLSQFSDIEIFICDVTDEEHFSLGSYHEKEVEHLLERTKELSKEEMKHYYETWKSLEEENGDIRIVENQTLVTFSFSELDESIINVLKAHRSISYFSFIGECMSLRLCGFYADIFFISRIDTMIEKGIIEICDIKEEPNFIGEVCERKYIRVKE